jgi:hypothetical protein
MNELFTKAFHADLTGLGRFFSLLPLSLEQLADKNKDNT